MLLQPSQQAYSKKNKSSSMLLVEISALSYNLVCNGSGFAVRSGDLPCCMLCPFMFVAKEIFSSRVISNVSSSKMKELADYQCRATSSTASEPTLQVFSQECQ